jgi:arylsulfatase A-like enzyme
MNVIAIINDSLRWDYLGCYGNNWIKTPNIDKLASESAVFDYFYPEGLPTVPCRTTFFTGRFTFPFRGWQRLEPTDLLLAEILWNKGFTSAMITDVYHLHKPSMAFERGFDYTEHVRGHEGDPWVLDESVEVDVDKYYKGDGKDKAVRQQLIQYLRNIDFWKSEEDTFVARVVKAGIKWLEEQPKRDNLLLWLDCFDPHEPWNPPPPYNRLYTDPNYNGKDIIQPIPGQVEGYLTPEELNHIAKLYAGKVTLCDHWVGQFLDKVKELGMYDNTLLIIRHPEGMGAGKRFDALVETTEIFPTILDFLNVRLPPRIHGESLLAIMSGEAESIRDYAYMGQFRRAWRVNDREWSFILNFDKNNSRELYNLKEDPGEKENLISVNPQKAMELELELRRFVSDLH